MAAFDNHEGTYLFPRFSSIIVFAKHLAVGRVGFTILAPRLDVVAFHLAQFKRFLALWADAFLPLVRFPLHVVGERANVEVSFVAVQDVRVDSRFLGHIVVGHQLRNGFF